MPHNVHPVHFFISVTSAKCIPFELKLFDILMIPCGQTFTHNSQPLHRSISILIFPTSDYLNLNNAYPS